MQNIKRKPRGFCYDKDQYQRDSLIEFITGRMRVAKKNQSDMGELIGMKQASFGARLRDGNFDYMHLVKIFKDLNATDEEILRLMKQE